MKRFLETGNFAVTEGAILAGCRFFAGYPITPATEIAEAMSRRLPQVGGIYVQAEDETVRVAAKAIPKMSRLVTIAL